MTRSSGRTTGPSDLDGLFQPGRRKRQRRLRCDRPGKPHAPAHPRLGQFLPLQLQRRLCRHPTPSLHLAPSACIISFSKPCLRIGRAWVVAKCHAPGSTASDTMYGFGNTESYGKRLGGWGHLTLGNAVPFTTSPRQRRRDDQRRVQRATRADGWHAELSSPTFGARRDQGHRSNRCPPLPGGNRLRTDPGRRLDADRTFPPRSI